MKIYTKTGDDGTTGLFAGGRVPKTDARIEAYGTVDELNAFLGLAIAQGDPSTESWLETFQEIQADLFSIGAQLATPDAAAAGMDLLGEDRIERLETWIDQFELELAPLRTFILPGGSRPGAAMHVARTVCRRAERRVIALSSSEPSADTRLAIVYLNRLSDLLFVLARVANARSGTADIAWTKPSDGNAGE